MRNLCLGGLFGLLLVSSASAADLRYGYGQPEPPVYGPHYRERPYGPPLAGPAPRYRPPPLTGPGYGPPDDDDDDVLPRRQRDRAWREPPPSEPDDDEDE